MNVLKKIAAILALFIGIMSVFVGSKVLLGMDTKEYNILNWLVIYNVILGVISIFTAYVIWQDKEKSNYLIMFILAIHFMVFIYLKFISNTVALESINAMIFRTSIWVVILLLSTIIPKYLNKK